MILVVENQILHTITDNKKYGLVNPFLNACEIYKCLYNLPKNTLKNINKILYILPDNYSQKIYQTGFKKYFADVSDYRKERDLVTLLIDRYPVVEELLDTNKRKVIEYLIRNSEFIVTRNKVEWSKLLEKRLGKDEVFCFYLPFCHNLSFEIISKLKEESCHILSYSKYYKLKFVDEIVLVDKKELLTIKKSLGDVEKKYKEYSRDPIAIRHFQPSGFLESFNDGFFEKIVAIIVDGKNKRWHFYGNDEFIARRAIKRILQNIESFPFEMPQDLPKIYNPKLSVIVYHFDRLLVHEKFKELYQKVKCIDYNLYVILQAYLNLN